MADTILFRLEGGLAWITLNRPEARNAINDEMRRALLDALARVAGDPAIRAAPRVSRPPPRPAHRRGGRLPPLAPGGPPEGEGARPARRRPPRRRGAPHRALQQGRGARGTRGGGARVGRAARTRPDARARHVEAPSPARLRERARDLPRGGGARADAGRADRGPAGGPAGLRRAAAAPAPGSLGWPPRPPGAPPCRA